MEDSKKSQRDVSRRLFLQGSAAAAIGMVIFGSLTESEAQPSIVTAAAAPHDTELEHWLLQTGREKLDPALYRSVKQYLK